MCVAHVRGEKIPGKSHCALWQTYFISAHGPNVLCHGCHRSYSTGQKKGRKLISTRFCLVQACGGPGLYPWHVTCGNGGTGVSQHSPERREVPSCLPLFLCFWSSPPSQLLWTWRGFGCITTECNRKLTWLRLVLFNNCMSYESVLHILNVMRISWRKAM